MLFIDSESLLVIIPHRLRLRLDIALIFLDTMQPLALGLTPHNGIPQLTLPQL
jgi:aromatic ring-opening dioxygenase LigB subunit